MTSPPPPVEKEKHKVLRWRGRVLGICLAIFAFELGLMLFFFPWAKSWDLSSIPLTAPLLGKIWLNRYFRGALSGLGLLNIYIGIVELITQIRLAFQKT